MHLPRPGFLSKHVEKYAPNITPVERDAQVGMELEEARKCIIREDDKCTIAHLLEAKKYEDCPVCERRIETFRKQVRALPRDKQLRKLELIQKFVSPSAEVHRMILEADNIRPRGGIYRITRTLKRTILRR